MHVLGDPVEPERLYPTKGPIVDEFDPWTLEFPEQLLELYEVVQNIVDLRVELLKLVDLLITNQQKANNDVFFISNKIILSNFDGSVILINFRTI